MSLYKTVRIVVFLLSKIQYLRLYLYKLGFRYKWGRLREGAESYAKALASDILR